MSLRTFNDMFLDEDAARAWFEHVRWPHGPECYHCGLVGKAWWIGTKRVWCCSGCRKHFSVTAGTPMHRTHLPLLVWLQALYLIVASSKGVSAVKLGEMLGVSYPTAWHLGHRVRAMMAEQNVILAGLVEIDEMYAGAPPRRRGKPSRDHDDSEPPPANPRGRGTKRALVLVAAERGGDVVAKVIPTHSKEAITAALEGVVDPKATVMTDGLPAYTQIGRTQPHLTVKHADRGYARTDPETGHRVHVNRIESFNGFMRRAVIGVWHQISVKHLDRYTSEVTFRWNRNADDCLDRMAAIVRNGEGRLLSYAFLTAKGT